MILSGPADKCTSCGRLFIVVYCSTCPPMLGGTYPPSALSHCFLGITHSLKVTRKCLKCLENAFTAISFSKKFWWRALRLRRSRATGSAGRRSADFNPVLSGKHGRAPQIDFTPYAYSVCRPSTSLLTTPIHRGTDNSPPDISSSDICATLACGGIRQKVQGRRIN